MKKTITTVLASILIFSCSFFIACGDNKQDIKSAMQGTWSAEWTAYGAPISRYYTFKGDTYTTGGVAYLGKLNIESGTYEIKDTVIHLISNDGSTKDLEYTYDKKTNTFILWWNNDIQFQKGRANVNYG